MARVNALNASSGSPVPCARARKTDNGRSVHSVHPPSVRSIPTGPTTTTPNPGKRPRRTDGSHMGAVHDGAEGLPRDNLHGRLAQVGEPYPKRPHANPIARSITRWALPIITARSATRGPGDIVEINGRRRYPDRRSSLPWSTQVPP